MFCCGGGRPCCDVGNPWGSPPWYRENPFCSSRDEILCAGGVTGCCKLTGSLTGGIGGCGWLGVP